ncbi:MAG: hypothetical protein CHACPFDD_02618 [Phycisphaerae bacterium]|nr:hypothetical protein [Phycisphaerae bacterium]
MTERVAQWWLDLRLGVRKAWHRRGAEPPAVKTAVHVVGCQRSGTEMTIYLLDRSLDVDRFNENHRAAFHFCLIRDADTVRRLITRSRAPLVVFKPICDSHRVSELLEWHRPSRAVWLYRDYRDVARSAVAKWGDTNRRHLLDLLAGGGDWGWSQWTRGGYTPELLDEVRQHIHERLSANGAAALYWYLRNRTYFSQHLEQHDDVDLYAYRDLVTNPLGEFARMCDFLGLAFSSEMAASVHARSLARGRCIELEAPIEELCESMLARLDAETQRRRTRAASAGPGGGRLVGTP